jgi:hypothetical protein
VRIHKSNFDLCGLIDVRYAPIATKFCNAAKCRDGLGDVREDLSLLSARANQLELFDRDRGAKFLIFGIKPTRR